MKKVRCEKSVSGECNFDDCVHFKTHEPVHCGYIGSPYEPLCTEVKGDCSKVECKVKCVEVTDER